jgi:AcrR family transcriptional regulator
MAVESMAPRIDGVEAATTDARGPSTPRELPTEKAARIVEAMRTSVAARGIAGSTFDHVAREAGVSRGLLHYYFGTKERLVVEVVRRECDLRGEQLDAAVAGAGDADAVLEALVRTFKDFIGEEPTQPVMFFEMLTLAQRNDEIAAELADLGRSTRRVLADALRAKSEAGVLALRGDADDIAAFLFALADGITVRRLSEPDADLGPVMAHAVAAVRAVLG